jgi:hypothetical protein
MKGKDEYLDSCPAEGASISLQIFYKNCLFFAFSIFLEISFYFIKLCLSTKISEISILPILKIGTTKRPFLFVSYIYGRGKVLPLSHGPFFYQYTAHSIKSRHIEQYKTVLITRSRKIREQNHLIGNNKIQNFVKTVLSRIRPVETLNLPVDISNRLVETTYQPVGMTNRPVESTNRPVEIKSRPVDINYQPVEWRNRPVVSLLTPFFGEKNWQIGGKKRYDNWSTHIQIKIQQKGVKK